MAAQILGRVFNNGNLKILNELDESAFSSTPMSYDSLGNLLVGGELIEEIRAEGGGGTPVEDFQYVEDTQADFQSGTLTSTQATTGGSLVLVAGGTVTGAIRPEAPTGTYVKSDYGLAFEVLTPVTLVSFDVNCNLIIRKGDPVTDDFTFNLYSNYTAGQNVSAASPYLSRLENFSTVGLKTVTVNWSLPVGKYLLANKGYMEGLMVQTNWTGTHPIYTPANSVKTINCYDLYGAVAPATSWYYFWNVRFSSTSAPVSSGNRVSNAVDLSSITEVASSTISWTQTIPSGTSIQIETSIDGGTTWNTATNGSTVPGVNIGNNLTGKSLKVRETLNGNGTDSPSLNSLTVTITQATAEPTGEILTIQLDGNDLKTTGFEEGVIL